MGGPPSNRRTKTSDLQEGKQSEEVWSIRDDKGMNRWKKIPLQKKDRKSERGTGVGRLDG